MQTDKLAHALLGEINQARNAVEVAGTYLRYIIDRGDHAISLTKDQIFGCLYALETLEGHFAGICEASEPLMVRLIPDLYDDEPEAIAA
ncbi:MAG: hypothetical protein ABSA13_12465 [Beijerinckiaceae bacterium]|jgi:hypothetical protein